MKLPKRDQGVQCENSSLPTLRKKKLERNEKTTAIKSLYIYTLSVSTLNSQQESDLLIFHKKKRDASLVQLLREHGTSGVRINQNDNQTAACGCLSVLRRTLVHGEDTNDMSSLLRVDCGLRGMWHFGHQTLVS